MLRNSYTSNSIDENIRFDAFPKIWARFFSYNKTHSSPISSDNKVKFDNILSIPIKAVIILNLSLKRFPIM